MVPLTKTKAKHIIRQSTKTRKKHPPTKTFAIVVPLSKTKAEQIVAIILVAHPSPHPPLHPSPHPPIPRHGGGVGPQGMWIYIYIYIYNSRYTALVAAMLKNMKNNRTKGLPIFLLLCEIRSGRDEGFHKGQSNLEVINRAIQNSEKHARPKCECHIVELVEYPAVHAAH